MEVFSVLLNTAEADLVNYAIKLLELDQHEALRRALLDWAEEVKDEFYGKS